MTRYGHFVRDWSWKAKKTKHTELFKLIRKTLLISKQFLKPMTWKPKILTSRPFEYLNVF